MPAWVCILWVNKYLCLTLYWLHIFSVTWYRSFKFWQLAHSVLVWNNKWNMLINSFFEISKTLCTCVSPFMYIVGSTFSLLWVLCILLYASIEYSYVYTYIKYRYEHTFVCVCVCAHVCMSVCMCVYSCAYVCISLYDCVFYNCM